MHRTVGDSYGTDGSKRIYRAEVPTVSDATQVTYDAMNALQEEIANVIEDQGLTLNSSSEAISAMTQLNSAIDSKVSAEASQRASSDLLTFNTFDALCLSRWQAIHGLQLSLNISDPIHDIDIGKGGAQSVDVDPTYFSWPMIMGNLFTRTKQIDVVWGAEPDPGGRASGVALTTGWYHVFIIGKSTIATSFFSVTNVDFGFDTSLTAANLKTDTGWGTDFLYRRIGSVYWDGSKILPFKQIGDTFLWNPPISDPGVALTGAVQSYTPRVPIGVISKALMSVTTVAAGTHRVEFVDGPLGSGALASQGAYLAGITTEISCVGSAEILTDTSGQFFWQAILGSPLTLGAVCRGYKDYRGEDLP